MFDNIIAFFKSHGYDLNALLAAFMGALIALGFLPQLTLRQSASVLCAGIAVDAYLVPLALHFMSFPATGPLANGQGRVTWINQGRFYSYRMATSGAQLIVVESGANDPRFNLRREPVLIQRLSGAGDAAFLSLLEPHGRYDAATETTTGSRSGVAGLTLTETAGARVATITLTGGKTILIAIATDTTAGKAHSVTVNGRKLD